MYFLDNLLLLASAGLSMSTLDALSIARVGSFARDEHLIVKVISETRVYTFDEAGECDKPRA